MWEKVKGLKNINVYVHYFQYWKLTKKKYRYNVPVKYHRVPLLENHPVSLINAMEANLHVLLLIIKRFGSLSGERDVAGPYNEGYCFKAS